MSRRRAAQGTPACPHTATYRNVCGATTFVVCRACDLILSGIANGGTR